MRPAFVLAIALIACHTELHFDDLDTDAGPESTDSLDATPPPVDAWTGACRVDTDCKIAALHCDSLSGECFGCTEDSQCVAAGLPRCDAALRTCVPCGTSSDCASGEVCDPGSRRCLRTCIDSMLCPMSAPKCADRPSLHARVCVGCVSNIHCDGSPEGPYCDFSSGRCVHCTRDEQCDHAGLRRCDRIGGNCVACVRSADCPPDHACDPMTHSCVSLGL